MKKSQRPYMEELDFSRDSRIRDSLLARIKDECFDSLEDDALDFLHAAGPAGEAGAFPKYQTDRKKRKQGVKKGEKNELDRRKNQGSI